MDEKNSEIVVYLPRYARIWRSRSARFIRHRSASAVLSPAKQLLTNKVSAWIALIENRNEEALQLMRAAADAEEATDKHPVTPGNVVPSRQLLGDMLLAAGQAEQALTEFERSLKRDPNRFRSIYGAAQAADATSNWLGITIPSCRRWPRTGIVTA